MDYFTINFMIFNVAEDVQSGDFKSGEGEFNLSREGAECLINNATASEKIDSRLVNSGEFIYFFEDGNVFISNDIDLINVREPDRPR